MQYAIRRMGFADPNQVEGVAESIYDTLRWEGRDWVMQYVCVGKRRGALPKEGRFLVEITFEDIGSFLFRRFREFPAKVPCQKVTQWSRFGKEYVKWVRRARRGGGFTADASAAFVQDFIDNGRSVR